MHRWVARPRRRTRLGRAVRRRRPDTTESPQTVDAGHLQFEVSLADWSRDGRDDTFIALQTNAKVGLTDSLGLGAMAQLDAVFDAEEDGHELEFLHTVVLGADHGGGLGSFFEYVGVAGEDDSASFNVGLTQQQGADLLLDAGVRLGWTDESDDVGVFVGFTARY